MSELQVTVMFAAAAAKSLQSCPTLQAHGLWLTRLFCPWDSSGKNTGEGCHFFFQEIFSTQGQNPCLSCLLRWQVGSLPLALPGKPHHILYYF